jgi:hypothetical protein
MKFYRKLLLSKAVINDQFSINIQNFYTMGQFSQKAPDGIFLNPLNYNMVGVS